MSAGRLQGRVAVVTGAASGIGAETARRFGREGALVVLADIDLDGASRVAAELGEAGAEALALPVDVGDGESFATMLAAAAARWGRLDVLVNNAGVGMRRMPAREVPDEVWERQLRLNLTGVWNGCRHAAGRLEDGGAIVNVASLSGVRPRPGFSAYSAAKAGVIALTQALAQELAPAIRVNAVSPVSTDTGMLPQLNPQGQSLEEFKEGMRSGIPMGRLNQPADVAAAILYLASDEAAMVTGFNLVVAGGVT
ncbi:MAG TPA: SDR family oxidoreductase [Solirubrobacterales bacterium]|nr:SDR family oxidoreductase [Solirubrobacterales bacterium]